MLDSTVDPDPNDTDETSENAEFPVPVDVLAIDGTRPEVGDPVKVKMGGTVTRVVNDVAYVKPETVNDVPLPKPVLDPSPNVDEGSRLQSLSKDAGGINDY